MTEIQVEEVPVTLSLILCSRNDSYMGNSVWRLETSLNWAAAQLAQFQSEHRAEIIVTDWGSEVPLRDVVRLTPAAARLTRFIQVPPADARKLQRDSPFPEVIALNAAARRARGLFVGRIDQDTLIGPRFLRHFMGLVDGTVPCDSPVHESLFFSNHRRVPYAFASMCPPLRHIDRFVRQFGRFFQNDHTNPRAPFYSAGVGIWLLPRAIWAECGGYDERMIYMNLMEVRMVERLTSKYPLIDLGRQLGYDFYHLEHYHPASVRRSSSHRMTNVKQTYANAQAFRQNDDNWGLANWPFVAEAGRGSAPSAELPFEPYTRLLLRLVPRLFRDGAVRRHATAKRELATLGEHWGRRVSVGWSVLRREPPWRWRHALADARHGNRGPVADTGPR